MDIIKKITSPSDTFGVQFIIRKDKLKDRKVPIYCRITVNGIITHFSLKQWIEPKYWDARNDAESKGKKEIVILNSNLRKVKKAIENKFNQMQEMGMYMTSEAVRDAFLGKIKEEPNTLTRLVSYHNEQAKLTLEWSTLKHYYVTQRYLTGFLKKKFNKSDVFLHEINYKFILDFELYLRAQKPTGNQKPLNNNGVMKHLIRLRKMTSLSIRLDWLQIDPFKNYKIRQQKVETDYLTKTELEQIENKALESETLAKVRDIRFLLLYRSRLC